MRTRSATRWLLFAVLACCPRPDIPILAAQRTAVALDGHEGVVAVLDDAQCAATITLAREGRAMFYVQLEHDADVVAARQAADAAGLLGRRIFVDRRQSGRIGLADNLADAVVVASDSLRVSKDEVLRVLRPQGKGYLPGELLTKPTPSGIDDWRHVYHGPDNNPQSLDRVARAPYLTQFVMEPRYAPAPQAAVASDGRLFMAFGHVAWHEREEPWMNRLLCVNGYNGTSLWQRELDSGFMVDRGMLVATPETLYLADHRSCKRINALTGEAQGEIVIPADVAGGTFWKWMALDDGLLYALIGPEEPRDANATWRRTSHGWPWNEISRGYNANDYTWGFGQTLLAIDPRSGSIVWKHREETPIDSRTLCMKSGRLYFANFGHYIAALDARSGQPLWRRTAETDRDTFDAIGPYRSGHGYIGGWKSTSYFKCTDKALYVVGPQVNWLTALSAQDGRVLWKHNAKDLHIVIRDDGLYTIGPEKSTDLTKRLDPMTGEILSSYATNRRACTRSVGTADSILFRGPEGTGRFDCASGSTGWISAMRPSCHVGVLVAAGHLYWLPWACDCNLQLFGSIALGPAGNFDFRAEPQTAERLEQFDLRPGKFSPASADDWPTYRHDNQRSAATAARLAATPQLRWRKQVGDRDGLTAPVTVGETLFLADRAGRVRAINAATGAAKWLAYTGGPIWYPPTLADGRALVGAGDGWVYCLAAADGHLLWRFRAAPADRRITLFGQLVSTWPVASGVLVEGNMAYAAAGITDSDGTHVYALNVENGNLVWHNGSSGSLDPSSPRGVACQGELLWHNHRLYLAGGNTVSPGVFEADTGKCLSQPPTQPGAHATRGRELSLVDGAVRVSGQPLHSSPDTPVFDRTTEWKPMVVEAANARITIAEPKASDGKQWAIVARDRSSGTPSWTETLSGEPVRWGIALAASGRLYIVLRSGEVLCYQ